MKRPPHVTEAWGVPPSVREPRGYLREPRNNRNHPDSLTKIVSMGLIDSVRSAVSRASDAVAAVKQEVVAKVEDTTARARAEVSGQVSSFTSAAPKTELLGAQLKADLPAGGPTVRAGNPSSLAAKLIAAEDGAKAFQADDVALANAEMLSPAQLQGLAQTRDGRAALERMCDELGSGWVAKDEQAQIDRLKHAMQTTPLLEDLQQAALKNNPRPSSSVLGEDQGVYQGKVMPWSEEDQAKVAQVEALVAHNTIASAGTPAEVDAMVNKTISDAKGLPPVMGGDLLTRTCDSLLAQGHTDAARKLAQELRVPPLAGTSVDTVAGIHGSGGETVAPNGNVIHYTPGGISGTLGGIGEARIAQADMMDRMNTTLGRKADPHDLNDVKAYFQQIKKTQGMAGAAKEFGVYVDTFAQHPQGLRADWQDARTDLVDPGKLTRILEGQPRDAAGRTVLDCEGHTWLAAAVFGQDHNVVYMRSESHIAVSVFDKKTGEGFFVNTCATPTVQTMPDRPRTETDRKVVTAQYFAGNGVKKGSGAVDSRGYVGSDVKKTLKTPG